MSVSASYLDLAARLALRARGYVEPNPLVGAVLVKDSQIIARVHHKRYGHLHAEAEALADCRAKGIDPAGSTLYVTLEPCDHFGKQPPCSKAIIEAGIAKVIIARADPNPISSGGSETLRRAGVDIEFTDASPLAIHISDPFIKRITTGLPWVIVKWAQTAEGRIAIGLGDPKWISNEHSRRRVHRLRGQVDCIVTGIGTVEVDDPLLTTRGLPRIRRIARRVILDSTLRISMQSALVRSASQAPVLIFCDADRLANQAETKAKAIVLAAKGVSVQGIPRLKSGLDLHAALQNLSTQYEAANILVEAGPRLISAFLVDRLADELLIHIAPPLPPAYPQFPDYQLFRSRPVAGDVELRYCRTPA
jgi:diaminohydroxyphosphoribosylaminopyrimidine deaminase/5-amino-6-(5-phosphoribosylamino)uracil reductase